MNFSIKLQGPSWQSVYSKLALKDRNMQFKFCLKVYEVGKFEFHQNWEAAVGKWISLCVKCCRMVDDILYRYIYCISLVAYTVRTSVEAGEMIMPA